MAKSNVICSVLHLLILGLISTIVRGYVITTPRRWTNGISNKVCVYLAAPSICEDHVNVGILATKFDKTNETFITPFDKIILPKESNSVCHDMSINVTSEQRAKLIVIGYLGGISFTETRSIFVLFPNSKTVGFADRFIYLPSQAVHIRFLTVTGPFLEIYKGELEFKFLNLPRKENETGNLTTVTSNTSHGLNLWSYQIPEDKEKGLYELIMYRKDKQLVNIEQHAAGFLIGNSLDESDRIIVKAPKALMVLNKNLTVEVCARNKYVESIKGIVTVSLHTEGTEESQRKKIVKKDPVHISGCRHIHFTNEDIDAIYQTNTKNVLIYANFTEDGSNGTIQKSYPVYIPVYRNALMFSNVSDQVYLKPELPYMAKVKVTYPDKTPAVDEDFRICIETHCMNTVSSAEGIVNFIVPPHLKPQIKITALNFLPSAWNNVKRAIEEPVMNLNLAMNYYSKSNSSLAITMQNNRVECKDASNTIDFMLPVHFGARDQNSANVSVQVLSRGLIQYTKTFEQSLESSQLGINNKLILDELKPPFTEGLVRGRFDIPISLPKTASPLARIIVWYTRKDGEVVADSTDIEISVCYLNKVSLSWSTNTAKPNEKVKLTLRAEPNSVCTIAVVDSSLQYISESRIMNYRSADVLFAAHNWYKSMKPFDYDDLVDNERHCSDEEDISEDTQGHSNGELETLSTKGKKVSKRAIWWWGVTKKDSKTVNRKDFDAKRMFDKSGLHVISDGTLEFLNCLPKPQDPEPFNYDSPLEYAVYSGHQTTTEPMLRETPPFEDPWIWRFVNVNETGVYEQMFTLPEMPANWLSEAVCVHPEKSIGLTGKTYISSL